MIVLDASVIIKWYNEEEDTEKSLKIQKNYIQGKEKISTPDLLLYELANAIRFSPANDIVELEAIIDNFVKLEIDIIIPTSDIIKDAGRISFKYKITIYDAVYIALAQNLGCEFVTADKKLYQQVKDLELVKLLENW